MGPVTFCKGLVGRQHVDAMGNLDARGAAELLIDALHVFHALSDADDDSAQAGLATPGPELVSLRRLGPVMPRQGEVWHCELLGPQAAAAADTRNLVLHGRQGAAWAATLLVDGAGARTMRAPPADLPAAVLARRMNADHCDQAGHVNVQVFLGLVDEAVAVMCREMAPAGQVLHLVQARVSFRSELFCGDVVRVHCGITGFDAHGVDMVHGIFHQPSGRLACVVESRLAALDASGQSVDPGWDATSVDAASIQAWPALPRAREMAAPRAAKAPGSTSVQTCQAVVDSWDADDDGWLQTRAMVNLCSTGARQYLAQIGLDAARFTRDKSTVAAIDYAIRLHRRPRIGCNLSLHSTHLAASAKSIRFSHHLVDSQAGDVYGTVEIVGVMLDLAAHRSTEVPPDIRARLEAMAPPST